MMAPTQNTPEGSVHIKTPDIKARIGFGKSKPKTPKSNQKFHFDVDKLFSPEPEKGDDSARAAVPHEQNKYSNDLEMFETPSGLFGNTNVMSSSGVLFNEAQTSTLVTSQLYDTAIFSGESLPSFGANSKQKIPDQFTEISKMGMTLDNEFSLSLLDTMDPIPVSEFDELPFSFSPNCGELQPFSGFKTPSDTNQDKPFDLISNFTQQSWNNQSNLSRQLTDAETSSNSTNKTRPQFEGLGDFSFSSHSTSSSKRGISLNAQLYYCAISN